MFIKSNHFDKNSKKFVAPLITLLSRPLEQTLVDKLLNCLKRFKRSFTNGTIQGDHRIYGQFYEAADQKVTILAQKLYAF